MIEFARPCQSPDELVVDVFVLAPFDDEDGDDSDDLPADESAVVAESVDVSEDLSAGFSDDGASEPDEVVDDAADDRASLR